MASAIQASSLLTLPLELRIKIYQELLNPDPARFYTLYHDRHGREASFDIKPTILRVNKQLYSEAISILYDNLNVRIYLATPVTVQCTGGYYPDHLADPPDLFREDIEKNANESVPPGWNTFGYKSRVGFEERTRCTVQGSIYPHCFQRLRRIQLVTSRHAIWGESQCGSYFSHIGKLVLRILKLLANGQATQAPVIQRLKLTVQPSWQTVESEMLLRNGETDKKTKAIVGLLKALKRRTDADIEIEEGAFTKTLRELRMEETEIDVWEKVLLDNADRDL